MSTWKIYTTLGNSLHTTKQLPTLLHFISRAARIYEHAWDLLSAVASFTIFTNPTRRVTQPSYAELLLTTHAQPQVTRAQPAHSHHRQNRNWAHVNREKTSELDVVPTFVTRWNLYPNGHKARPESFTRQCIACCYVPPLAQISFGTDSFVFHFAFQIYKV